MPYGSITLNDGHEIPAIAFGTGTALYGKGARDAVIQALDNGFTHVDTAQMYRNEDSVGDALKDGPLDRSKIYLTTKFGGGDIETEFNTSLKKLGVDYVDLYLIHFPKFVPDFAAAWKTFEGFKEKGLAKSIGVSNFTVKELQTLLTTAKIKPAVNQIRFHPYNYAENKELLEFASANGIIIESYSTLTPLTKEPGGPVDAPVAAAAKRIGATPAQVILLWAQAKGVVVVTTTSSKDRVHEYLKVPDLPPLTPEEIAAIDLAGSRS